MSEHDWLKQAAGALRDEHEGDASSAAATRARVLSTLSQRERSRRRWLPFTVPIAAVFLLSTAWAASTGRLPALRALLAPSPPVVAPTVVAPAATTPRATGPSMVAPVEAPAATAPVEAPSTPAPVEAAPDRPGEPEATAPRAAPSALTASSSEVATPASSARAALAEEDRLYREAHQAHFVERNPARALAAWDAYLRTQKSGRFATEATYNRALSLVRLGRTAEARQALAPFAQGKFGSYRKDEAQKLLDAL